MKLKPPYKKLPTEKSSKAPRRTSQVTADEYNHRLATEVPNFEVKTKCKRLL